MRGVVFGLLFSNLAFLAWNLFVPATIEPRVPALVADAGTRVQLLSEVTSDQLRPYPERQQASTPASVPEVSEVIESPDVVQALYCAQIGPFRNEDDARNFANTHAQRMSLSVDIRQVPAAPDYRVFLPPFASRELATSTQETLRAAFAANNLAIDTYLVPRGELENSIALGLFSEQRNALNVQQQMLGLGYQVVVRTEEKQVSEAWVLAENIETEAEFAQHWAQMRLTRSYIDAGEKLCETIAHTPQFP
tara:strand:- start:36 stop:785 length:750 start_codon:yes stop_codon:yes gene_type:complete